ncbi:MULTISPECIES: transcription elongation factor GreA [Thermodesulfovibrio]|uniref:Transcription elongation factor GreA n=1 Tax=Thermodesulfovibrio yellowstonii (strain ATCC 51303 / DSM 11347 / YP87) TaxID=289376 RepID=GREA_THEYD|nr:MULTISPECIES: transcription elongation factor GreA [Thermodesulfovibrio]B5YJG9.1 RecName: Full=Transcription elongation factor GreA; AltName: Full=Transcript cleavage factor GreA [Thermodesulfovibrio yellowstonii DSM 11347]ACI20793.1 transcription elongation factor GreA [Thermodesulfovibrio yellowstonii DSM 11347]
MTDRIPMTPEGYEKLKEELDRLIKIERPAIIKAIAEARAHGDLSENAEYHAAREKQSFIEGRIQELQAKLARAYVIDPSKINQNKVAFGAKVRVIDIDTEEEKEFHLVGPDEADVKNGKISITSPVGKALIGKEVGEQVTIKAPAKTFNYEIISISFE